MDDSQELSTSQQNPVSDGIWMVLQSVAKDGCHVKAYPTSRGYMPAVFITKAQAEAYLADVIETVKREQAIGARPANNLDPEESLDFCIVQCHLVFKAQQIKDRGWKVGENVGREGDELWSIK